MLMIDFAKILPSFLGLRFSIPLECLFDFVKLCIDSLIFVQFISTVRASLPPPFSSSRSIQPRDLPRLKCRSVSMGMDSTGQGHFCGHVLPCHCVGAGYRQLFERGIYRYICARAY